MSQNVLAAYRLRTAQSGMRAAHAFTIEMSVDTPAPDVREEDLFQRANRLFGAAMHMVLVNDVGPTLSVMGWVLGSARVDVIEGPGESRTVVVDVIFTDVGKYAVAERVTRQTNDPKSLGAALAEFSNAGDVYRFCESTAGPADSARDAALAAALDHAVRAWSPLRRSTRGRFATGPTVLPFRL